MLLLVHFLSVQGSPPRGRGKEHKAEIWRQGYRITPAWAGKRQASHSQAKERKDHPRVGGEKDACVIYYSGVIGSPPRGRGKVVSYILVSEILRITPAWAGKSFDDTLFGLQDWDHPRVGGEKPEKELRLEADKGSPPRGRGKAAYTTADLLTTQDHPRVGGEKIDEGLVQKQFLGSPPRGRGKANTRQKSEIALRITPAWAGKRLKRSHRSGIFISGPIPFHSVLHRPAGSGGSRAGRDGSPAGQPQNTGPA